VRFHATDWRSRSTGCARIQLTEERREERYAAAGARQLDRRSVVREYPQVEIAGGRIKGASKVSRGLGRVAPIGRVGRNDAARPRVGVADPARGAGRE